MEDDMHVLIKAPSRNVTLYLLQPWGCKLWAAHGETGCVGGKRRTTRLNGLYAGVNPGLWIVPRPVLFKVSTWMGKLHYPKVISGEDSIGFQLFSVFSSFTMGTSILWPPQKDVCHLLTHKYDVKRVGVCVRVAERFIEDKYWEPRFD